MAIAGILEIQLLAELGRLSTDMRRAEKVVADSTDKMGKSVATLESAFGKLGGTLMLGAAFDQVRRLTDDYTKLTAQLRIATSSQADYAAGLADVRRISTAAQADINATTMLYTRLTNSLREHGATQKQVSNITESVSLGLKAYGATATEASSAMLQLSQAFGANRLGGDEFRAVAESMPNMMQILAKSMGVPYAALKVLSAEGKITAKEMMEAWDKPEIIAALRKQADMTRTITGEMTVFRNNLKMLVGEFMGSSKGTEGITSSLHLMSDAVLALAENLKIVVLAVTALGMAYAGKFIVNLIRGIELTLAHSEALKINAAMNVASAQATNFGAKAALAQGAANALATGETKIATAANVAYRTSVKELAAAQTAASASAVTGITAVGIALRTAIMANPITAAVTAIGLIVVAIANWKTIVDSSKSSLKWFRDDFLGGMEFLAAGVGISLGELAQKFMLLANLTAPQLKSGEFKKQWDELGKLAEQSRIEVAARIAGVDKQIAGEGKLAIGGQYATQGSDQLFVNTEFASIVAKFNEGKTSVAQFHAEVMKMYADLNAKPDKAAAKELNAYEKMILKGNERIAVLNAETETNAKLLQSEKDIAEFMAAQIAGKTGMDAKHQSAVLDQMEQIKTIEIVKRGEKEAADAKKILDEHKRARDRQYADETLAEQQKLAESFSKKFEDSFGKILDKGKSVFGQLREAFSATAKDTLLTSVYESALKPTVMKMSMGVSDIVKGGMGSSMMASVAPYLATTLVATSVLGGIFGHTASAQQMQAVDPKFTQQWQGTGTVLGDISAKSTSVATAMDTLNKTTFAHTDYLAQMTSSMHSVDRGINNFMSVAAKALNLNMASQTPLGTTTTQGLSGVGSLLAGAGVSALITPIVTGALLASGVGAAAISAGVGAVASTAASAGLALSAGTILTGGVGLLLAPVIGSLLSGLFGSSSTSITGTGINLTGTTKQLQAGQGGQQYASGVTTSESLWGMFSSSSAWTRYSALDTQVTKALGAVFQNIGDTITVAAVALGGDAATMKARVDSFVIATGNISMVGMTVQQQQQALTDIVSKQSDLMVNAVAPGVRAFQVAGEGMLQTLVRLTSEVATLTTFYGVLGDKTVVTVGSADAMITALGGVDAANQSMTKFVGNFASETTKSGLALKSLESVLSTVGLAGVAPLIKTTQDYFALMQVASNEQRTALLQQQDVALAYIKSIGSSLTLMLDKASKLASTAKTELGFVTSNLSSLASSLKGAANSLYQSFMQQMTPDYQRQQYKASIAQISDAYTQYKATGVAPNAASLQQSISNVSAGGTNMFASATDWKRSTMQTIDLLSGMGNLADAQVTVLTQISGTMDKLLATQQEQLAAQNAGNMVAAGDAAARSAVLTGNLTWLTDVNTLLTDAAKNNGLTVDLVKQTVNATVGGNTVLVDTLQRLITASGTTMTGSGATTGIGGATSAAGAILPAGTSAGALSITASLQASAGFLQNINAQNNTMANLMAANVAAIQQTTAALTPVATNTQTTAQVLLDINKGASAGSTATAAPINTLTGNTGGGGRGGILGGVVGAVGSVISSIGSFFGFSDPRLKENISPAGFSKNGFMQYNFSYKNDPAHQMYQGVMADEVRRSRPDAVYRAANGFDMVNYSKLGLQMQKMPSFAVGTNSVPFDMTATIHAGEEITPRPYVDAQKLARDETNALLRRMSGTPNDALISELRAVRAELADIRRTNQNIDWTTEKWDNDGTPDVRQEVTSG